MLAFPTNILIAVLDVVAAENCAVMLHTLGSTPDQHILQHTCNSGSRAMSPLPRASGIIPLQHVLYLQLRADESQSINSRTIMKVLCPRIPAWQLT